MLCRTRVSVSVASKSTSIECHRKIRGVKKGSTTTSNVEAMFSKAYLSSILQKDRQNAQSEVSYSD